jgi:hypothetical protein
MINHVVFFKLKDKSAESIEKAKSTLMSMKGKILDLKHIEVGIDIVHTAESYDIALLTSFDNIEGLDAYRIHPEHLKVREYMLSVGEFVVVDYESS